MRHALRRRPQGHLQCTRCRAGFLSEESARLSVVPCPDEPVTHGLPGTRDHVIYPPSELDRSCAAWGCDEADPSHWHGPDPYCDDMQCGACMHVCDCEVCTGLLEVRALHVLEDPATSVIYERERKAKMAAELKTTLDRLSTSEYVKAEGVDTRGHKVTRAGTMLAPVKPVRAQRNGVMTKGWRLFVGAAGADPSERSTWVTVFPEAGSVEVLSTDPNELEWKNTELREAVSSSVIMYGGRGGKKPKQARKVSISYTEGGHELRDLETNEPVDRGQLRSRIWWAPMPADHNSNQVKPKRLGRKVVEHQDQAEPEQQRPAWTPFPGYRCTPYSGGGSGYAVTYKGETIGSGRTAEEADAAAAKHLERRESWGRVPENTLYMAEHANTEAARAWWRRRVEDIRSGRVKV